MSEQYRKFGELSRAEQLELVEHVLDGGEIEMFDNILWYNTEMGKIGVINFYKEYYYRKLKSELELLKEQRDELDKKIEDLEGIGVGDFVRKRGSNSDGIVYKVFNNVMSKDFPYMIGGHFYKKNQVNHQFMEVQQQQ